MIEATINKYFLLFLFITCTGNLKSLDLIPKNIIFIKNTYCTNSKIIDEVAIGKNKYVRIKFYNEKNYKNERDKLSLFEHENIIKIEYKNDSTKTIIEDLADCSLENFLKNPKYFLDNKKINIETVNLEKIKLKIIKNILKAIKYLHNKKQCLHLDLKPDNILLFIENINEQAVIRTVLSDLESCIKYDANKNILLDTKVGATEYLAPEIIEDAVLNKPFLVDTKIDIYALGLIILFIVHDKFASDIILTPSILKEIKNYEEEEKLFSLYAKSNQWLINFLKDNNHILNELIINCCNKDPFKRYSIEDCICEFDKIYKNYF
ncbi:protein kinase [Candidatus Dependentiae bacterium]|nr:protein kinase [Candidatus Dependentiae bacterium]MBU4387128.1 protein kinase [Candidatus Dependentiae bacterium]MCG2756536.1 protein kinase [Candidatus Dependentiae bacterium]